MTQEYEFFKDFAGVTKADLEMFKCGGTAKKKKKMEEGGKTKKKYITQETSKGPFGRTDTTYTEIEKSGNYTRETRKASKTTGSGSDYEHPAYKGMQKEYNNQFKNTPKFNGYDLHKGETKAPLKRKK